VPSGCLNGFSSKTVVGLPIDNNRTGRKDSSVWSLAKVGQWQIPKLSDCCLLMFNLPTSLIIRWAEDATANSPTATDTSSAIPSLPTTIATWQSHLSVSGGLQTSNPPSATRLEMHTVDHYYGIFSR
jgi:hypothetical protein